MTFRMVAQGDVDASNSREPLSIECGDIRNSEWLPDHVKVAMGQEHTPEQAILLANSIQERVGQHPFPESESDKAHDALDFCGWLRYWAGRGVSVQGCGHD